MKKQDRAGQEMTKEKNVKRVSAEQLADFPESVLEDIYRTLNTWNWHETLGEKPENWDELPNYRKPHMDECETKEDIIRPYMTAIRARIAVDQIYPYSIQEEK